MTLMRRSSPFGEMLSLRQAMDRLFEDSFVQPRGLLAEAVDQAIPLDVASSPDALVIEAVLPGVKPENVEITVLGETVTINATTGEERKEKDGDYVYREVRRGRFSRTVTLPAQVDSEKATASFENGMLRLTIPKAEQARPRQIRIGTTSEGTATAVGPGPEPPPSGSATG